MSQILIGCLAAGLLAVQLYQVFTQRDRAAQCPDFAYEIGRRHGAGLGSASAGVLSVLAIALATFTVVVSLIAISTAPGMPAHVSGQKSGGVSIHAKNGQTPDWMTELFARSRDAIDWSQVSVSI